MLFDKLKNYSASDIYPFHMPGHKRNQDFIPGMLPCKYGNLKSFPYDLDITEIPGFDDLHDMHGTLLETSKLAASLYGSREAFLLTGGSTLGILAAIGSHTKRGDKILANAGCHRSVSNAARLFGLELIYIDAEIDEYSGIPGSVTPKSVEEALRNNPAVSLVVVTSPSYEGIISDIASIAEITHKAGAVLLVDCAHGAHLGFSEGFPAGHTTLGADIIVMSLHKTLPALTQCSLLHACSDRTDTKSIKQMLGILQTSSPSYVLMASIDYCLNLLNDDTQILFDRYEQNLAYFCGQTADLRQQKPGMLYIPGKRPGFFDIDPGKIIISVKNTGTSGFQLMNMLRDEYKLEFERACDDYVIAMTSICDTREGFQRLSEALREINIQNG